ncbi:MAG: DUF433 domain-containing protein [Gemmatales bacterium]
MTLPDYLMTDEFGAIRLTGTRIGLSQLLWYYLEGQSVESLQQQFPTLGFALIHKVLAFYWENKAEVDEYLQQAEASMAKNALQGAAVDMESLRLKLQRRKVG